MDINFKEFKKEVWTEIIIKCVSFGLAAAFVAVDAVFLPCRLYGINFFGLYYVLIALGGFALGGGIAFLIFRTDDKKIAKRLDRELKLEERVQTAYVFSGQQSDILDLQREDAGKALGGVSLTSLKFANLVALILSAVIAVAAIAALPVTVGTVPFGALVSKSGHVDEDELPRDVTDWEWAALDELIIYVQSSKKADATVKAGMVSELLGLRSLLLNGVSNNSLTMFVQNTVTNIRNIVNDANESGISQEQQDLNNEESDYVTNKLYEIFDIPVPKGGDEIDPDEGGKNPDEEKKPDENPGYEIGGNDVPFFDPETGYTTASDSATRNKYYEIVQKAFEEGTISREEWEYIMATYFADLSKSE